VADSLTETVRLVETEASRTRDFLAGLEEVQWSWDSSCEGWTVADVAAHLSAGANTWANSIGRAVEGDSGPPEGQVPLAPGQRGSEIISQSAISYRQEAGSKLMESFSAGYDLLRESLSKLKQEDWDKPCYHRRGPMTIRDFVALRVQELAVHGWDIRWGIDNSAELWEEPLGLLSGRVPRWLRTAFTAGLDLPVPVRYRFDIAGPVEIKQDVAVNGGEFQIEIPGDGEADAVFNCDTGNYILLIFGRLDVKQASAEGRLDITGSMEQAGNFTSWFKGF
jgi:uncharacterized protein (TIGR03083 family)